MIPDSVKVEYIRWVDSYSTHDIWVDFENMKSPKLNICVSIGYVICETDDSIQLASHISDVENEDEKGMCSGIMVIPKVAILNRSVIVLKNI